MILSTSYMAALFLWLVASCQLVESRKPSRSVFANLANLVAHGTGPRKRKIEKAPCLTHAVARDEPEHAFLVTAASRSDQYVDTKMTGPTHLTRPSFPDPSPRFRVPLLILLHMVIQTGIAEANHGNFVQLYRIGILHATFGVFLVVAEKPSCGLVGVCLLLLSLLSSLEQLRGSALRYFVYGGVVVWLVLLTIDKHRLTTDRLPTRLTVGSVISLISLYAIPKWIPLVESKAVLGALALFLYFDLSKQLLFPNHSHATSSNV